MRHRARITHQRRHRAIVLWLIAGTALMQLGLSALIETRWTSIRDPEYAIREERWQARILEAPENQRLLFLGSSRVACGINAKSLEERLGSSYTVFNFGIPKAGLFSQKINLERLAERSLLPDVVVIEVMVPFLAGRGVPVERRGLDAGRFSLNEISELDWVDNLRGPIRKWLFHRAFPAQVYSAELRQRWNLDDLTPAPELEREKRTIDAHGWRPAGIEPSRQAALTGLAHRQYAEHYRGFALHPEQQRRLHELIERCRHLGLRTAVLLMPEGNEFRSLFADSAERQLQEVLTGIRNKYSITVIDARAWMPDDAFIDQHHLHHAAADQFTNRLADTIREAVLKGDVKSAIVRRQR